MVVACLYQDAMEYLYQASDSAITLQVVETSGAMEASSGAVAASTNDEVCTSNASHEDVKIIIRLIV